MSSRQIRIGRHGGLGNELTETVRALWVLFLACFGIDAR